MSSILIDIRYSARKFVRTPGLSLALLLTIALGIGSNVTVHGFVRGLARPDSPLASVDRVVSVFGRDARRDAGPVSFQDYLSLQSHLDGFEWVGAARVSRGTVTVVDQSAIRSVAAVTSDLAGLLNLSLDGGVVISHGMWEDEFHAKPDVRGEQIRVDGTNVRVAGVAPDWLEGIYRDRPVDLWTPLHEEASQGVDRNIWVLGRLRRVFRLSKRRSGFVPAAAASATYA